MGRYLLITAKRSSMKQARVLAQSTKKIKDGGDEALLDAIAPVVTKLFGVAPQESGPTTASRDVAPAGEKKSTPLARPAPATQTQPQSTALPGAREEAPVSNRSEQSRREQRSSEEQQLDDIMRDGRKRTSARPVPAGSTVRAETDKDDVSGTSQLPVLPVALLSAGGVALGIAGYFQFKAWGYHRNATDEDYEGRQVESQSGRSSQTYARVSAAGGVVLTAAGALLWQRTASGTDGVGVSALPTGQGALVLVSGGF
jgi:hypothetical protein